ncbi:hypothetical protein N0V93_000084 [Gnomoniopsis smithogilvyi]|uniref:Uncharacterized protein n=1 Tax=Gnomoniopsis smithogilvyi TaxID=1191159 RepID=A0A9W9D1C7_9PEZI|nr:hypothetical protein N0V93_000084 [Gnomoniopsis smithogilvyi]
MFSLQFLSLAILLTPCLAATGPPMPESPIPPKVEPTKLDNFTWRDPFSSPKIHQFDAACESSRTFAASEFQLHDLSAPEPQGLLPFRKQLLAVFGSRNYPGGWDGMDAHGYERNLLKMDYKDVPIQVRKWIEEQEKSEGPGKGLFAVLDKSGKEDTTETKQESDKSPSLDEDKIVMFAPGAVYETLPLWLAQDSACEGALTDLSKYSPKFVHGGVVGWPIEYTHPSRSKGERNMSFTLKAQVLDSPASASEKIDQDTVQTEAKDEL